MVTATKGIGRRDFKLVGSWVLWDSHARSRLRSGLKVTAQSVVYHVVRLVIAIVAVRSHKMLTKSRISQARERRLHWAEPEPKRPSTVACRRQDILTGAKLGARMPRQGVGREGTAQQQVHHNSTDGHCNKGNWALDKRLCRAVGRHSSGNRHWSSECSPWLSFFFTSISTYLYASPGFQGNNR